jgi:hypothetical protein
VLALLLVPMVVCTAYVRAHRVETTPRSWSRKRVFLTISGSVPFVLFIVGALYVTDPTGSTWVGAAVGGVLGSVLGIVGTAIEGRRRRRREAAAALTGDDD